MPPGGKCNPDQSGVSGGESTKPEPEKPCDLTNGTAVDAPTTTEIPTSTQQPTTHFTDITSTFEPSPDNLQTTQSSTAQTTESSTVPPGQSTTPPSGESTTPQSTTPQSLESTTQQGSESTTPQIAQSTTLQGGESTTPQSTESTTPQGVQSTNPQTTESTTIAGESTTGQTSAPENLSEDCKPPTITCFQEGFFGHPTDCKKFYRCVDFHHNGQSFTIFHFDCGVRSSNLVPNI
jgi:hypothetical protein